MTAILLTLAIFLYWSGIGVAGLTLLGADVLDGRVALAAPVFGSALMIVPLFVLSNAGLGMQSAGPVVLGLLLVLAAAVIALQRPALPRIVGPLALLALVELLMLGRPFFTYGLDWIANANTDMAYYVMSASHLLHHGLQSPVDVQGMLSGRDLASSSQSLNLRGLRPGTQIGLSALAGTAGRPPVQLYMVLALAVAMATVCAVGSLTLQAVRSSGAAVVAGAIFVVSPMAGYGLEQQLTPQNWGLALATGLFAFAMRPELYRRKGLNATDVAIISILGAGLFVVAFEVATSLAVGYCVFVAVLAVRRRISPVAVGVLWAVPVALTSLVLNTFFGKAMSYLWFAVGRGSNALKGIELFGYAIVPTALPGFTGLRSLFAVPASPHMSAYIVVSAALIAALLVIAWSSARRGSAAAVIVLGDALLALFLIRKSNSFGLFKLYMYVQPFLAATLGAWLVGLRGRRTLAAATVLAVVGGFQFVTLTGYVEKSFHPVDLPDASHSDLVPRFRSVYASAPRPIVSDTDNMILAWLEASTSIDGPLHVIGRDAFAIPFATHSFRISRSATTTFKVDPLAARLLDHGTCTLVLPTGAEIAANRRTMPEAGPPLRVTRCGAPHNTLLFLESSLGQTATLPQDRSAVAFWQLVKDPLFHGGTLSGFGRYALFQVLGPSRRVRVVLTMTMTPLGPRTDAARLPSPRVVGAGTVKMTAEGTGSARVVSPPITPRRIGDQWFIALDMGRPGAFPNVARPGLTGLWKRSAPLDPRTLTSYVRDVSLVAADAPLPAPAAVATIPQDLQNPNLQYSGLYEDGWMGKDAFLVLHPRRGRTLSLLLQALPVPGQRLNVLVDGRVVYSHRVNGGSLALHLPVAVGARASRVELRWRSTIPLGSHDPRQAAARVEYVGFAARPGR